MNPPPQQPFNSEEIDISWSDEQIIVLLHEYTLGSRLPRNVLTDLDPFQHSPDTLPEGAWYLVDSNAAKESAFGFWVLKTDPRQIQSGPVITGWTTTWDYMKFMNDFEETNWMMQKYTMKISECFVGLEPRVGKMLCRFFQSGEPSNAQNEEPEPEPAPLIPAAENEPQPAPMVPVAENEAEPAPLQEAQDDYMGEFNLGYIDGYLELDDLEIPSSSDSSCISYLTDEDPDPQDDVEMADVQAIDGDAGTGSDEDGTSGSDSDTSGSDTGSSGSDSDSDSDSEAEVEIVD